MRLTHVAATAAAVALAMYAPQARAQFAFPPESLTEPANPARPGTAPSSDQTTQGAAKPSSGWVFGGALSVHAQSELTQANPHPATGVSAELQPETAIPGHNGLLSNTYVDSDLQLFANYSTWLSFNGDVKLERTRWDNLDAYYPGANNFLNHEALTLRQAYVTLRPAEGWSVYGGKIHPAFGSGYEEVPGQFYTFATDYEQDERIGFGTAYHLPESLGLPDARLSFEIYYLDTSFLSNTVLSRPSLDDPITDRALRYTRSQFGPSNTGALNSYTVAFRGGAPERGLRYQVSYTSQATSDPDGRTSHGVSAAVSYESFKVLNAHWDLTPYVEYAWFDNYNNVANLTRQYVVGGVTLARGRWTLSGAGGVRVSQGYGNATDHQENISVAYALTDALSVGGGVAHTFIGGRDAYTFGPSLTYDLGL